MLGKKTGGRTKGSLNKASFEVKKAASVHGPEAIERLSWLMLNAENQQTQAFAAEKLLDRGFGKPTQTVESGEKLTEALKGIKVTFGS